MGICKKSSSIGKENPKVGRANEHENPRVARHECKIESTNPRVKTSNNGSGTVGSVSTR